MNKKTAFTVDPKFSNKMGGEMGNKGSNAIHVVVSL